MHTKAIGSFSPSSIIHKICASHLLIIPCLIVVLAFVLASSSHARQWTGSAEYERLKARKSTLDTERAQLEREWSQLVEKGQKMRLKTALRAHSRKMQELRDRIVAHQSKRNAFENDWEAYHRPLADSPNFRRLKAKKSALDTERAQLEKEWGDLMESGRKLRSRTAARAHKRRMKELNDRAVAYRRERDAFENDWEAYLSSQ